MKGLVQALQSRWIEKESTLINVVTYITSIQKTLEDITSFSRNERRGKPNTKEQYGKKTMEREYEVKKLAMMRTLN